MPRSTAACATSCRSPWRAVGPTSGRMPTHVKVREAGRIVSVAVIIGVGVNAEGRREVLGMAVGASEAETFWLEFLRGLKRRGLAGVKLVISNAHEEPHGRSLSCAARDMEACRVHFACNALANDGKAQRRLVSAQSGPPTPSPTRRAPVTNGALSPTSSARRCRGLRRSRRRPRRTCSPTCTSRPPTARAALEQPDRAPQQRDQPPHQHRRYHSERGRRRAARGRAPARAVRRMGHATRPLLDPRGISAISDTGPARLSAVRA